MAFTVPTITAQVVLAKGNPMGLENNGEDNQLVLVRRLVREAIDESGWKHDAVAAAMSLASGLRIDGPYLAKLLSGEKTISAVHIRALPDDIETIYARKYAESFGLICVTPVDEETARRHLVSGLVGVLAPRRLAMAKAVLKPTPAKAVSR